MMKLEEKTFVILMFIVLLISFISGSFSMGEPDYSIDTQYGPSDYIRGWINISLNNEPTNSFFRASEGDTIGLIELLELNNVNPDCVPTDCGTDYGVVEGSEETSKTFTLNNGNYTILGLKISGGVVRSISDFSMHISSTAGKSVRPQLFIDILDDDKIEWQSYLASDPSVFGNEDYGCYQGKGLCMEPNNVACPSTEQSCDGAFACQWNSSAGVSGECQPKLCDTWDNNKFACELNCNWQDTGQSAKISSDLPYCEKITLSPSPNIKIGARVINHTSPAEEVNFSLEIHDISYYNSGSCITTATGTQKIECIPEDEQLLGDFKINKEGDFFVCISTEKYEDRNKYKISYERDNVCGFSGDYSGTYTIDFEIFARTGKYATMPADGFVLNNTEFENIGIYGFIIEDYIWNYIDNKYGGDCTTECIIPIRFTSGKNQEITISNIQLSYVTDVIEDIEEIYNLTETPAKISSGFIKLNLDDAEFSVPDDYGEDLFSLYLGSYEVFTEEISIEKIPIITSLFPTKTATAFPTKFKVNVESPANASIIRYKWDFGNNDTDETTTNSVIYTYDSVGEYNLKISVTDENQLSSSRIFLINVSSPEELINSTLDKMQRDLTNVKTKITNFDLFAQNTLNSLLSIDSLNEELTKLQRAFKTANSETEYNLIMTGLLDLRIPKSIDIDTSADSLLFFPQEDNINLEILQTVGGGNYNPSQKNEYIKDILAWNQENLESRITFKRLSVKYEDITEPVLRLFELEINEKNSLDERLYLILKKLDDLKFKENYLEREKSGYIYIPIRDLPKTIIFSTTENVDFIDLPLFISPEINSLSVIEDALDEEEKRRQGTMTILTIILIILIGIAAYFIYKALKKKRHDVGKYPEKRKGLFGQLTQKFLDIVKKKKGVDHHMYRNRYSVPQGRPLRGRFYRYH